MELLTYKSGLVEYTYYLNKNDKKIKHGGCKEFCWNGNLVGHEYWYHGKRHGEVKQWLSSGFLIRHVFYIGGEVHPYVEMNKQEKLLFQIKHPGFRFFED